MEQSKRKGDVLMSSNKKSKKSHSSTIPETLFASYLTSLSHQEEVDKQKSQFNETLEMDKLKLEIQQWQAESDRKLKQQEREEAKEVIMAEFEEQTLQKELELQELKANSKAQMKTKKLGNLLYS